MKHSTLLVLGILAAETLTLGAAYAAEGSLADHPGAWRQQGYGKIFDISNGKLTQYDYTRTGCVLEATNTLDAVKGKFDRIAGDANSLSLYEAGEITRYDFVSLRDGLPVSCQRPLTSKDPIINANYFWDAFRENYAFFNLRGVDWEKVYNEYRAKIKPTTTNKQLLAILTEVIKKLNDGHVEIESPVGDGSSGSQGELQELYMATVGQPDWNKAEAGYLAAVDRHVRQAILKGQGKSDALGLFLWGHAEPGIGYIDVVGMEPDKDKPVPEILRDIDVTMNQALTDLADAKVLIVDARFNDGGYDAVALQIMAHLTDIPRPAFRKKAVIGNGYTEEQAIRYGERPAGQIFTGPVIYLQSGTTISAAEAFTLAMMTRPCTRRVGRHTYGAMSDQLEKRLPNRWTVTVSNEVYTADDGKVYEKTGVPPHVEVPVGADRNFDNQIVRDFNAGLREAEQVLRTGAGICG